MTPIAHALDLVAAVAAEDELASRRLMHGLGGPAALELVEALAQVGAVFARLGAILDGEQVTDWLAGLRREMPHVG